MPPPAARTTTTAAAIHHVRRLPGSRPCDGRPEYAGPGGAGALGGGSVAAGAVGAMVMVGGDASSSAGTPKSRPQPPQNRVLVVRARPQSGQKVMRIPHLSQPYYA